MASLNQGTSMNGTAKVYQLTELLKERALKRGAGTTQEDVLAYALGYLGSMFGIIADHDPDIMERINSRIQTVTKYIKEMK
jgi:hypothetical protein